MRKGGLMSVGNVRGRHYTEYVDTIKHLKRSGQLDELEALLLAMLCDNYRVY